MRKQLLGNRGKLVRKSPHSPVARPSSIGTRITTHAHAKVRTMHLHFKPLLGRRLAPAR
jgi:hypothetical protein